MKCTGWIKPRWVEDDYNVKIEYVAGKEPKSTILIPIILPRKEIHMYRDHSICLHYPPDMIWNVNTKVYKYTIPWISEWIIYYEIFKRNGGKWIGPESPHHIKESDKNANYDVD